MRNIKYVFVILVLIAACKCNNEPNKPTSADSTLVIPDTLLAYEVNTEAKTMKRFTEVPDSAFTASRVINGLNDKYRNIHLQLVKQSNDTLYVSVPDNEFLGERMGSTGASSWFQDAVINLTAVPNVNYVHIQMQERSHALPGVFSKQNIKGFKEVRDSIPVS